MIDGVQEESDCGGILGILDEIGETADASWYASSYRDAEDALGEFRDGVHDGSTAGQDNAGGDE